MSEAAPGEEGQRRLSRSSRITGSEEIRRLFQRGKRSRTAHLDVYDSPSPVRHPRTGVIVPRHKQSAVRRNRLKRQLREIVRVEVLPLLDAAQVYTDLLVRARPEAYQAVFGSLRDELVAWVKQRWLHDYSSC